MKQTSPVLVMFNMRPLQPTRSGSTRYDRTINVALDVGDFRCNRKLGLQSSCRLDDWPEIEEGVVKSRRLARYTLDDRRHSLRDLHAEELHELVAGGRGGRGGLKARAWLRLTADEAAGAMVPQASSLAEALAGLPDHVAAESLQAAPVQVTDPLYLEVRCAHTHTHMAHNT